MAKTKIEWTATRKSDGTLVHGYTFNSWIGCSKVSDGCKHCYAETWAVRKPRWADSWGPEGTRIKTSDAYWRKPLMWNRQAEAEGIRRKVFCASLADVFEDRPELSPWRIELFDLIEQTPHLDWLLLTKRPENIMRLMPVRWANDEKELPGYTLPNNVWIGTSVENQEQADKRIPELLKVPASVKFLSMEPLLGPVNLSRIEDTDESYIDCLRGHRYSTAQHIGFRKGYSCTNWVIVGGESGPKRRPMNPDWARDLRDQCKEAGVPYFFKQVDKIQPIPEDLMIRKFPNER